MANANPIYQAGGSDAQTGLQQGTKGGLGVATTTTGNSLSAYQSTTIQTQTSTRSSSQSGRAANNDTVSQGALAGGIVGAFLGGALIAFLISFLFMSWRRKRDHKNHGSSMSKNDDPTKRHTVGAKVEAPLVDPKHAWELHLPQPADDASLRQAMKTLYDRLELHVENFYSNSSSTTHPPAVDEENWATVVGKLETPYLPSSLEAMLRQGRAKTTIMKHCIAYLTVSGIDLNSNSSFPLLPTELTSVPQAAPRANQNKAVFTQALTRHSQLSGYLLNPISVTLPHFAAERDETIASAVGAICTAFAPWANSSASTRVRMENLTQILREASDMGIMLCGQPNQFIWNWKLVRRDSRNIVILPTFLRLTVEDGSGSSSKQAKETELVVGKAGEI